MTAGSVTQLYVALLGVGGSDPDSAETRIVVQKHTNGSPPDTFEDVAAAIVGDVELPLGLRLRAQDEVIYVEYRRDGDEDWTPFGSLAASELMGGFDGVAFGASRSSTKAEDGDFEIRLGPINPA